MRLVCVIGFTPDKQSFGDNHEKQKLIWQGCRMKLNPDDGYALGFALHLKKQNPDLFIEVVTMAPLSVTPLVENILRVGVDRGTLVSDGIFAGSDTATTSRILGKYLKSIDYDYLLAGSFGDDSKINQLPPQVSELLNINYISGISSIDEDTFSSSKILVEVEEEKAMATYELSAPAFLGLTEKCGHKLPYVRLKDSRMDVGHRLQVIDNSVLGFEEREVGPKGSLTKTISVQALRKKTAQQRIVGTDSEGIEYVYNFLKEKRFI
ncbi:electron transfer flavoprotein subunit beta/FixA family protein [Polycladidibacter stylochi]|uniref:electron transfer flavoprotein subunit beta/FixA family protein n=1 Tax=Polycladidibacter stylochi TaxID=1807766 RepID=UPI000832538D|nr:hypothetical protein [Pseudovibrio stylochi]